MTLCHISILLVLLAAATMISSLRFSRRPSMIAKQTSRLSNMTSSLRSATSVSHPSFEKLDSFSVTEYAFQGDIYRHRKSGAQVVSINTRDDNKVFGITFRTPPEDSTGVPHVLEHSVLCGSRKFPVKEPFVDLLRGSLQNFLNAFTYPDRTCYPVASTNTKDFYNLVHVYLDAVLHPRAVSDPQVLQQEGWHYELENDDPAGALSIKGVVYNEMKGVYSSPDSLMGRATQQALFPHNTYGVDSGGDPLRIPDLTFEQFKAFHAQYYHPSNSRIFFYGDDDPLQRLVLLDEYLNDFDAVSDAPSSVPYHPKLALTEQQNRVEVPFPLSPGSEPKHMITLNWVLNHEAMTAKDSMALGVLDYLLLGTSSSALKKALTESGLGESVTGGGISEELLQSTFSVGMKGVQKDDAIKVEALIRAQLLELADKGFPADAVEAAMNTYEFKLREFNTGGFPKGLSIMLGMMAQWIYDKPPLQGIRFEEPLRQLKSELAAGTPVFQDLLNKYFVSNTHCVAVEMKPDFDMETQRVQEEEARLSQVKGTMTPQQLEQVIASSRSLRVAQEAVDSAEARATLPVLGLDDIDPLVKELPIRVLSETDAAAAGLSDAKVLLHELDTSGILYADVAFDYSGIDVKDLELLPLLVRMFMEAGTKQHDLTALTRRIGAKTGGIGVSTHNDLRSGGSRVVDPDNVLLYLVIRGKAVAKNVPTLFELFSEILQSADLSNQKRAVEMLKESKVRKESAILSSGHSYGATRLNRASFLGHVNEVTGGLTSVRAAGALLDQATADWPAVQARLERMRAAIVAKGRRNLVVNLTGDEKLVAEALPKVSAFVSALPSIVGEKRHIISTWDKEPLFLQNEGFTMPSQVNYVAMGGPVLAPGLEVKGSYAVAARYLSTGYLWDNVRVLGGAYGGFARFSVGSGRMVYLSYRDPNCINTINVYDEAATVLQEAEVSSEEVLQAVIGSIGDLDAPMSADQKGFSSMVQFLSGETPEDRQRWRHGVLNSSSADFKEFATHLQKLREKGSIVVFGAQSAIEAANQQLPESRKMEVQQALLGTQAN